MKEQIKVYDIIVEFEYDDEQSMYSGSYIEEVIVADMYIKAVKVVNDSITSEDVEVTETLVQGIKFKLLSLVCLNRIDAETCKITIKVI